MPWEALLDSLAVDHAAPGVVVPAALGDVPCCTADELVQRRLANSTLLASSLPALKGLSALIGQVPHVCAITDADGVVLDVAAPSGDAPRAYRCQHGAKPFESSAQQDAMAAGGIAIVDDDPHDRCTLFVALLPSDGMFRGAIAVACRRPDMTIRLAAAAVQRARLIELDVQVAELRKLHERVVGTIGHELRQPLAALVTALDLVARTSESVAARPLHVAQRQTLQMMHLVDSLLDVSRMMAGKLQVARRLIDVRQIVNDAVESVRADIDRRQQRLTLRLPNDAVWCLGDAARLQQVAVNLLTNAHRYTPEQGRIAVVLEETELIELSVRDSGAGISPAAQEHIFRPFVQSPLSQGLGLGLSISRGIVELHGGTLHVRSEGVNAGSIFVVRLPGVLERSKEVRAAVARTRATTRLLMQRAQMLRSTIAPTHRRA